MKNIVLQKCDHGFVVVIPCLLDAFVVLHNTS